MSFLSNLCLSREAKHAPSGVRKQRKLGNAIRDWQGEVGVALLG